MDKKNFKNAHDIGENMAVLSGEGRSYTIINKETGKTRQLVSESGSLMVADNEIDFNAIKKGCPDFNGRKSVRYWFGRYNDFRNGICAICWTIHPDGRYFADEDGFGMEDNDEEKVYCIINKDLEIIVPFQPMDNVMGMLKKYEKLVCWLYIQKIKQLLHSLLYMRVKMPMWLALIVPTRKWSNCCIMFLHKNESCYLDMTQTKGCSIERMTLRMSLIRL